ncbi:MAG TPA: carboxypeptidase-like regulatory domain-containing protein [Pyrinomonadaceae bacterium]|nr:carboxypeptidase-like regulatory domain-containing protein [Pyrinomonadaceae bacterium]
MKNKTLLILTIILSASISTPAQADGITTYTLEQSVIASGGGTSANGGAFSLIGTIGQPVAGTTSTNSPFSVSGGFFTASALAPTAAGVNISGRVRMANGKGIRNVLITLIQEDGTTRTTLSGLSGKYSFTDVAVGQTVILSATAKRFSFSQPTQFLNLTEEASGIDFTALEQFIW